MQKLTVVGNWSRTVDEYLQNPFRVELSVVFNQQIVADRLKWRLRRLPKAQQLENSKFLVKVEYGPQDLVQIPANCFSPEYMFEPVRLLANLMVDSLTVRIVPDAPYSRLASWSLAEEAAQLHLRAEAEYWTNPSAKFIVYQLELIYRDEPLIVIGQASSPYITVAVCLPKSKLMLYCTTDQPDERYARELLYRFLTSAFTQMVSTKYVTGEVGYVKDGASLADVASRFVPLGYSK